MTSNISNSTNVYFFKNETEKSAINNNGYLSADLRNYVRKKSLVYFKTNEKIESEKAYKNLRRQIIINVCLIIAVIVYTSLGALMFQILEQHEELRQCEEGKGKFEKELKHYRELIINFVSYNISNEELNYFTNFSRSTIHSLNPDSFQKSHKKNKFYSTTNDTKNLEKELIETFKEINKWLEEFRKKIIEIESTTSFFGQDCIKDTKWGFYASLLFTLTVISTVGYGFIAPVTWEGRVVCICYASIGIPIYLVCLTNLSSILGQFLRFAHKKIQSINPVYKYWKNIKLKKKKNEISKLTSNRISKRDDLLLKENKSFIGIPTDNQSISTSKLSFNFYLDNSRIVNENSFFDDDEEQNDQQDDEDEDLSLFNDEVPFLLAFTIIIGYILLGGFLFSNFEGWTLTESIYFIFGTLTTMGFGDLVPGLNFKEKYADAKILIVCIYSSLGMAIIGMCLGQMQFAFKRKLYLLIELVKQSMDFMDKSQNEKTSRKSSADELTKERNDILNKIKMLRRLENESFNRKRRELNNSSHTIIEK